jgi:hypothetical protein
VLKSTQIRTDRREGRLLGTARVADLSDGLALRLPAETDERGRMVVA